RALACLRPFLPAARKGSRVTSEWKPNSSTLVKLQAAKDPHQIVNLASGGSTARFKVLLHAQTRKEGQNHGGQFVHIRLRLFSLDIPGNELLQSRSARSQNFVGRRWQD